MKKTKVIGLMLLSSVMLLGSCGGSEEKDYQYNTYMAGSPSTWNVHTWQTNDDAVIIGYTETGLYDFVLNDAKTGYDIISEMADGDPIDTGLDENESNDLTDEEIEKYQIDDKSVDAGAEGFKWIINLNQDACWEDGTPINADTYIYSMQQLLNPKMQNYRATSYYQDTLKIANAEKYFKSDRKTFEQYSKYYDQPGVLSDGQRFYSFDEDSPYLIANVNLNDKEYKNLVGYMNDNFIPYFERYLKSEDKTEVEMGESLLKTFSKYVDFNRIMKTEGTETDKHEYYGIESITINDEKKKGYKMYTTEDDAAFDILGMLLSGSSDPSQINEMINEITYVYYKWDSFDWNDVGLVKTGDYQLTLYVSTAIEEYYLKYKLSSNWIVYEPYYEAGKSENGKLVITNYATRQKNYMSYGPYKLTRFQVGKSILLERNDKWYGYTDGKHVGKYQTTCVNFSIITEHSVALQKFLKGDLDDVSLTADDMKIYGNSERLYRTQTTFSQKLTFNTDYEKLSKRQKGANNKTILANHDFREAFSYAMNRQKFAAEYTSGHVPSTVLLNNQYISDYNNNEIYRETKQGESVSQSIYGDITNGYSVKKAKELFQKAYEAEIASTKSGHLTASDNVEIEMLLYNTDSEATKAQILFIRNCLEEATKGTDLENKIKIVTRKDEDYYNTAYNGDFDCIWSIWGGMTMDPFGFMQVYTSESTKCEYGFHPENEKLLIKGELLEEGAGDTEMTYDGWRQAIGAGGKYAIMDRDDRKAGKTEGHQVRLNILAELEKAIILRYEAICFTSRAEAELLSYKVEYAVQNDLAIVGRGGIRELTYNFTASEWAKQKKTLDYTYSGL